MFRANSMDTSFFAVEEPALPSQDAGVLAVFPLTCSDSVNRGTSHVSDGKWLTEDSKEKTTVHQMCPLDILIDS